MTNNTKNTNYTAPLEKTMTQNGTGQPAVDIPTKTNPMENVSPYTFFRVRICGKLECHSSAGDPSITTTKDGKKKRRRRGRRGGKNNKKREKIISKHTTIKIFKLSSSTFNDTELNVLHKGLNFAPKNPPNLFEIFVDLNRYMRNLTLETTTQDDINA